MANSTWRVSICSEMNKLYLPITRGSILLSALQTPNLWLHQAFGDFGWGSLGLCCCAGWRTTHPHGCWDVWNMRGGAPLSLLIHGLGCLAILVGWPCSTYGHINNNSGRGEAAIWAASYNFLLVSKHTWSNAKGSWACADAVCAGGLDKLTEQRQDQPYTPSHSHPPLIPTHWNMRNTHPILKKKASGI